MMALTQHGWTKDWQLVHACFDYIHFPEAHTGENISNKFTERAEHWGRPFQITTDSGANIVLGSRLFLGKEGPPSPLSFPQRSLGIRCSAHALDNVVKEAFKLPGLAALFERQSKMVRFFRKSNKAMRLLKAKQEQLHAHEPDPFIEYHNSLNWNKVRLFLPSHRS
jgi:hypothetical protein